MKLAAQVVESGLFHGRQGGADLLAQGGRRSHEFQGPFRALFPMRQTGDVFQQIGNGPAVAQCAIDRHALFVEPARVNVRALGAQHIGEIVEADGHGPTVADFALQGEGFL